MAEICDSWGIVRFVEQILTRCRSQRVTLYPVTCPRARACAGFSYRSTRSGRSSTSMPSTPSHAAIEQISYLRSLPSIRERCHRVWALALQDKLDYWTVDLSKQATIVDFVCSLITRDYGEDYDAIPPHGRWRHFGDRVEPILERWEDDGVDPLEKARRMVDLMVTSVLLDAGAGDVWKFSPKEGSSGGGAPIGRSEGLAVGSLEMFEKGFFSGVEEQPCRVDGECRLAARRPRQGTELVPPAVGLSQITTDDIATAMQVSDTNPMTGIEGRAELLVRLGTVLSDPANSAYFTSSDHPDTHRPGHIIDYLLSHATTQQIPSPSSHRVAIQIETLWDIVVNGLSGVWPAARSKIEDVPLGDVWPVDCLKRKGESPDEAFVSFHKLSQWMTYSLIEV